MVILNKIDSNVTGLRFCEEVTIGVLPAAASQIWYPLEPNSYSNWGGQTKLTQRAPITDTRQKKKGVLTDLDAAGSINMDMTLTNYQRIMEGFMFADFREKFDTQSFNGVNSAIGAISAPSTITLDVGNQLSTLKAGDLIHTSFFDNGANNGLFHVASVTNTYATNTLTAVSVNFAAGDTVTIGTKTYTYASPIGSTEGNVLVGATPHDSLANLAAALNHAAGAGTLYVAAAENPDVSGSATLLVLTATARTSGAGPDSVATTVGGGNTGDATWATATLTGGAASIVVTETSLVNDASPAAAARVEIVGHEFASGDLEVSNTGASYPELTTSSKDLRELNLIPGEFIYIGGDVTNSSFSAATDNGWARVRSVAQHAIVLDKTTGEMVTNNGSGKLVQVFFGRVVKNEANHDGSNNSIPIKRRTYSFERTLGSPDTDNPTEVQAEYLVGAVPDKFKMNLKTADKVTSDLDFIALNTDLRDAATGPKSKDSGASAPDLVSEDAFNTTSHVARMRLAVHSATDASPTALIGFVMDMDFTIGNNLKANKAIGVLGAFEVTAGHFTVDGTLKAYFATVAAQEEVKRNGDVTLDIAFVEANKGVLVDMPLIALSDGRPDVVSDEPIMLPLNSSLAPDPTFNHTLLWVFYNYLPDVAQPEV